MRLERKAVYILSLFALMFVQSTSASSDRWVNSLRGGDIDGGSVEIYDIHYGYMQDHPIVQLGQDLVFEGSWTDRFQIDDVQNRVVLRHLNSSEAYYPKPWEIRVSYTLVLTDELGQESIYEDELMISYTHNDGVVQHTDLRLYEARGLKSLVKVTNVDLCGLTQLPSDVIFDLELSVKRCYFFDQAEPLYLNALNHAEFVLNQPSPSYLDLGWEYIEGAESYDLEWLFVESPCQTDIDCVEPVNKRINFDNATRINLKHNSYKIPMTFPTGYMVYRVRPRGRVPGMSCGKVRAGAWSYTSPPGGVLADVPLQYKVPLKAIEKSKNWQYEIAYSEQGAHKQMITYYDGAYKKREQVTKSNTDNFAIVSTTHYDHQGREAVNVLPFATEYQGLGMYLTRDMIDFKLDEFDQASTYLSPPSISSSSPQPSASKYYSSYNNLETIHKNYLPDAQDYPYTRTLYTNDGSNRVSQVSGLGPNYQFGTGREQKIFYGKPASQRELDRLFLNDAGYYYNYNKELARDANGQYTVSYKNLNNQVVATALSVNEHGEDQLQDIDSYNATDASENITNSNLMQQNILIDNSSVLNTTYLHTGGDSPVLAYSYDALSSININLGNDIEGCDASLSFSPSYNVDISVLDVNGDAVAAVSLADGDNGLTNTITLDQLEIGSYDIHKELSVNIVADQADQDALLDCVPYEYVPLSVCGCEQNIISNALRDDYYVDFKRSEAYLSPTGLGYPIVSSDNPEVPSVLTYQGLDATDPDNSTVYTTEYEYSLETVIVEVVGSTITELPETENYTPYLNLTVSQVNEIKGEGFISSQDEIADVEISLSELFAWANTLCTSDFEATYSYDCFQNLKNDFGPDGLLEQYGYFEYIALDWSKLYIDEDLAESLEIDYDLPVVFEGTAYVALTWEAVYEFWPGQPGFTTLFWDNIKMHSLSNEEFSLITFMPEENQNNFDLYLDQLVVYHPEYCIADYFCSNHITSFKYLMWNTNPNEANALGLFAPFLDIDEVGQPISYINNFGFESPTIDDVTDYGEPYYDAFLEANPDAKSQMLNLLMNFAKHPTDPGAYVSIWEIMSYEGFDQVSDAYTNFASAIESESYSPETNTEHAFYFLMNQLYDPEQGYFVHANKYTFFTSIYLALREGIVYTSPADTDNIKCGNMFGSYTTIEALLLDTRDYSQEFDLDNPSAYPYLYDYCGTLALEDVDNTSASPCWDIISSGSFMYDGLWGENEDQQQEQYYTNPHYQWYASSSLSAHQIYAVAHDIPLDNQLAMATETVFMENNNLCKSDFLSALETWFRAHVDFSVVTAPGGQSLCAALVEEQAIIEFIETYVYGLTEDEDILAQLPNWDFAINCANQVDYMLAIENIRALVASIPYEQYETTIEYFVPPVEDMDDETDESDAEDAEDAPSCTVVVSYTYLDDQGLEITADNLEQGQTAEEVWASSFNYTVLSDLIEDGNMEPIEQSYTVHPCIENMAQQQSMMINNQQAALTELLGIKMEEAISQALDGVSETMSLSYPLNEYHYTLYYYDVAGNLEKTVAPKGVNIASIADTDLSSQQRDNTTGEEQDLFSEDLLASQHNYVTDYKYNSLNAVTESASPDGGVVNYYYDEIGRIIASQDAHQAFIGAMSYTLYDQLGRVVEVGQLEAVLPASVMKTKVEPGQQYSPFELAIGENTRTQVVKTIYTQPGNPHSIDDSDPANISLQTTLYDPNFKQENLRNRVSYVCVIDKIWYDSFTDQQYITSPEHTLYYSYDIHGNVSELLIKFKDIVGGFVYKTVEYKYDLISANVKQVEYQKGFPDQYYHRYYYDADNRITEVQTSADNTVWDTEAKYFYYAHGPLARMEIAEGVQAIDYAYTLQGWVKAVNGLHLDRDKDMGIDAKDFDQNGLVSLHANHAQDAYAYALGYYNGDYSAIGQTSNGLNLSTTIVEPNIETQANYKDLYNGNISKMLTSLSENIVVDQVLLTQRLPVQKMIYSYDKLNRLKDSYSASSMDVNNFSTAELPSISSAIEGDLLSSYQTNYSYDANGNITKLKRNDQNSEWKDIVQLDVDSYIMSDADYGYNYTSSTNKLWSIHRQEEDSEDENFNYVTDYYSYYDNGNLKSDTYAQIEKITWTNSGKVKTIEREQSSDMPDLEFRYDALGNRVAKIVKPDPQDKETWDIIRYIRDANGNIMTSYKGRYINKTIPSLEIDNHKMEYTPDEYVIYGANRLGVDRTNSKFKEVYLYHEDVNAINSEYVYTGYNIGFPVGENELDDIYVFDSESDQVQEAEAIGLYQRKSQNSHFKNYELSNHLGNVLMTVADRKIPVRYEQPVYTGLNEDVSGLWTMSESLNQFPEWEVNGEYTIVNPDDIVNTGDHYLLLTRTIRWCFEVHTTNEVTIEFDVRAATFNCFDGYLTESAVFVHSLFSDFDVELTSLESEIPTNINDFTTNQWYHVKATYVLSDNLLLNCADDVCFQISIKPPFTVDIDNFSIELMEDIYNRDMFIADVESYSDYYPFGLTQPGRTFSSGEGYRYGFNGMEADDEIAGDKNSYDFGARIYDSRVARWLSLDPLAANYAGWSPYNFTLDNPIRFNDPDGKAPNDPNCCGGGDPLLYMVTALGQDLEVAYDKFEYEFGKAYDATADFFNDLFKTETPPTGSDIMNQSSNSTIQKVGKAVDVIDMVKDAGEVVIEYKETNFDDPAQKADFIEKSIQKGVEQLPLIGDPAEVIMNDAKKDDGLMNLNNGKMSNSYKGSYNARNAWLQSFGAQNRNSEVKREESIENEKKD